MLRLLSDLNKVTRFDVEATGTILSGAAADQGTFVVKNGDTLALPTAGTAAGAMAIFTEANRDGTDGWSPDVKAGTGNSLTVLYGKYRAVTDQFTGTPAAGTPLTVNTDGVLAAAVIGTDHVVAVCTKASHTVRHLQADTTVIEILTV